LTQQGTKPLHVGGQAVIEGVMMRSPNSYVVVCRLPDGRIALRESPWRSIWNRLAFLRKPLLRGGVVLVEALHNGLDALSFSAREQAAAIEAEEAREREEQGDEPPAGGGDVTGAALTGTLVLSVLLAIGIFIALPHALAWAAGSLLGIDLAEGTALSFHAIVGLFKTMLFVGYLWAISRLEEIHRVFAYHGAEHKSIHAYEHGEELTVDNARKHSRFHPRCGTSFLFLVIVVSVLVFSVAFAFMPELSGHRVLNQALYILIKLPLLFPIAGLAYEAQKLSARAPDNQLVRLLIWPGLALQRITTVEPTDEMLEVALLSLRKVLWREGVGADAEQEGAGEVEYYDTFASAASAAAS